MTTRIFTCNPNQEFGVEGGQAIVNQELPGLIHKEIQNDQTFLTCWRCSNIQQIQVGDRAYLWKTTEKPTGFVAAGEVIKAPVHKQTRRLSPGKCRELGLVPEKCSKLSAAYYCISKDEDESDYEYQKQGFYFVYLAIDSAVSFDYPLEIEPIQQRVLQGKITFSDQSSGGSLSKGDPDVAAALEAAWQAHIKQREHKGYQLDPAMKAATKALDQQDFFNPPDLAEERKRMLASILQRRGQAQFRKELLEAYDRKCAITACDAVEALEAAHIIPHVDMDNYDPINGILLRADLHTLFDRHLLVIEPDKWRVLLAPSLQHTQYRILHKQKIRLPGKANLHPDSDRLRDRISQCDWFPVEKYL